MSYRFVAVGGNFLIRPSPISCARYSTRQQLSGCPEGGIPLRAYPSEIPPRRNFIRLNWFLNSLITHRWRCWSERRNSPGQRWYEREREKNLASDKFSPPLLPPQELLCHVDARFSSHVANKGTKCDWDLNVICFLHTLYGNTVWQAKIKIN